MDDKWKGRARKFWSEWIKPILVVVIVCCSFRSAVADWNDVPTGSMKPTILEGDRIFVNKLAYDLKIPFTTWHLVEWGGPGRGDIVVCYSPADGARLVKRVIAIPGDRVEMRDNRLFINGEPIQYDPLDAKQFDPIADNFRSPHFFVTEQLNGHPHAVMITPAIRSRRSFPPITVSEGEYFVMGDNRDNSRDSRMFGFVPRSQIVGRSSRVVLSLDRDNYYLPRVDRFLEELD